MPITANQVANLYGLVIDDTSMDEQGRYKIRRREFDYFEDLIEQFPLETRLRAYFGNDHDKPGEVCKVDQVTDQGMMLKSVEFDPDGNEKDDDPENEKIKDRDPNNDPPENRKTGLFIGYNLDNNRNDDQVEREIKGLLSADPLMLGMCETIGNRLPAVNGYRKFEADSGSSELARSRANVSLYVREDLPGGDLSWIDCNRRWPRTQGSGMHEPRSYLVKDVGGVQVIIAHQPQRPGSWLGPTTSSALYRARAEGISRLSYNMRPRGNTPAQRERSQKRPRIMFADFNARRGEPQGPQILANNINGRVTGGRIDLFVSRGNIDVSNYRTISKAANGVNLLSDHHHAVQVRVSIPGAWL